MRRSETSTGPSVPTVMTKRDSSKLAVVSSTRTPEVASRRNSSAAVSMTSPTGRWPLSSPLPVAIATIAPGTALRKANAQRALSIA